MKYPIAEFLCSDSMLVAHSQVENDALSQVPKDYGLKPNGITIDMMRESPEFYRQMDDLDRFGVAAQESGKLSSDVKKIISTIQSRLNDRNKPKNSL